MTDSAELIHQRLIAFGVNTPAPRWSSYSLEKLFASVVSEGGDVGDVFQALYLLVEPAPLSTQLTTFVKDLATCAFSKFRDNYHTSDWQWLCKVVERGCTPVQAYLALYTVPPESLSARCVVSILQSLAGTPYWSEAVANLEEEIEDTRVRDLLSKWLATGVDSRSRADVERLARRD